MIPACHNYSDACDQIARLGAGIYLERSLESEIDLKYRTNVFYSHRGLKLEKDLELIKKDRNIVYERNDDVFELTLLNQKKPS